MCVRATILSQVPAFHLKKADLLFGAITALDSYKVNSAKVHKLPANFTHGHCLIYNKTAILTFKVAITLTLNLLLKGQGFTWFTHTHTHTHVSNTTSKNFASFNHTHTRTLSKNFASP